jgi:hypothetical protein
MKQNVMSTLKIDAGNMSGMQIMNQSLTNESMDMIQGNNSATTP